MLLRVLLLSVIMTVMCQEECVPCDQVTCPALYQCVAGVTPDRCGCCQVITVTSVDIM